jgi:hypothetical protein
MALPRVSRGKLPSLETMSWPGNGLHQLSFFELIQNIVAQLGNNELESGSLGVSPPKEPIHNLNLELRP